MLKRFYKQLIFIFVIASMIILISGDSAIAKKGTKWHVYPWMSRAEIQATVDDAADGDTIYFHAALYDWSDAPVLPRYANEGAINIIEKTLTIKGQKGTIIIGPESGYDEDGYQIGSNAFHVLDTDANNDVTFDGLTLQEFMRGIAVWNNVVIEPHINEYGLPNARNVTIKNCTFLDIRRDAISLGHIRGNIYIQNNDIFTDRGGMYISWYNSSEHPQDWQPEDTFVSVLENRVNTSRWGILIDSTTNVLVKKNSIDSKRTGILNYSPKKGNVITSNSISNCRSGIQLWGGWYLGMKYEAEGAVIEKNELSNITRWGIFIYGDECYSHIVSTNKIHMVPDSVSGENSFAGIYLESRDDYFGQNKISGSGLTAFWLGWWDYSAEPDYDGHLIYTHNETLQANNVNQFSPDICHFYLDEGTHNNLIVGSGMGHNTYIDDGYNNRITGVTPMAGGIGQDLNEAVKERNEELKEARKIKF